MSQPIRVLHIISNLRGGGAQVCVKYLVQATAGKVESVVYPLRSRGMEVAAAGEVVTFPYKNYDTRKFTAIGRLCRQHRIDIIHAHLEKPILGALLASLNSNVPVIVHEHGPVMRQGFSYAIYRCLFRMLHRQAAGFIAISPAIAQELQRRIGIDGSRITLIPNAVDTDVFTPDRSLREKFRQQFQAQEDDLVIGFVGRLNYVKGADMALDALPLLLEHSKKYRLVMVGDGPERGRLEERVRELKLSGRVHFTGFCANVAEVMQAFDVGVMPSRQEPFGMVALEFMSMKIPLVCSGVEGLGQLVTHRQHALVLQDNTPAGICDCIHQVLTDRPLRERLIKNASELCADYSVVEYGKKVLTLYEQVLSDKGTAR
ncbi:MAG: glycosyltransferase family 4 protein [Sedimentisphaerales bacterium]|nr:glycosyltransferase family 4 protein [Sedimentisphaerales bacterium]